jgi:DNA (cytosine-5)-methyltransferase 1
MKFLSVCSGIEAASVAWHLLGWESVAYSEIELFPCKVLQHHYPDVPNLGDMTKFKEWPDADVNVFVGGTPCQSFSVAGLRKGLDDPRGNLMLTYLAIAQRYRPNWLVWENVPGVLSSAGGRDFGSFLGGLAELGYGFAYRVLDAQYFGVAQRRKRVFVVGYFGDWRPAAAVLFERHSLQGHPAPSREKGKRIADTLTVGANQCSGFAGDFVEQKMIPALHSEISPALKARDHKGPSSDGDGDGAILVPMQPIAFDAYNQTTSDTVTALRCAAGGVFDNTVAQPIALAENIIGRKPENGGNHDGFTNGGPMYTLNATGVHGVAQAMAVRRLTPVECERLQGFPDRYTDIQPKGKATPDGPRYKALGNSMAVPVMAWIGKRIQEVDAICKTQQNT